MTTDRADSRTSIPPRPDEPRRPLGIARLWAIGIPVAITLASVVAALSQLDCTSDCLGGAALVLVSPVLAPLSGAEVTTGGSTASGALAVFVTGGAAVAWWWAVVGIAVGLARRRQRPRLTFWTLWLAAWVVTYALNVAGYGLQQVAGWVVATVVEGLALAAVLVIDHRIGE